MCDETGAHTTRHDALGSLSTSFKRGVGRISDGGASTSSHGLSSNAILRHEFQGAEGLWDGDEDTPASFDGLTEGACQSVGPVLWNVCFFVTRYVDGHSFTPLSLLGHEEHTGPRPPGKIPSVALLVQIPKVLAVALPQGSTRASHRTDVTHRCYAHGLSGHGIRRDFKTTGQIDVDV